MVDSAHQVIVACEVTNQPVDKAQAVPIMEQVRNNTGQLPNEMSADAGYFSTKVAEEMAKLEIETFIPPHKIRHASPLPCAPRGHIAQGTSLMDRMKRKMKTVEPVLGQIKQGRGFRQFLLRGLNKVRYE